MEQFTGKVAAITGAASGIGRALALELASRGSHLALSDIDENGLTDTVAHAQRRGVVVTSTGLDVAERPAVFAWADQVVSDHGRVNLIFNNAGVALGATVEQMRLEDFEWLMDINFWGVVHGTQAFLPHLVDSGAGHVVNISSIFGLLGIPSQSAYNAAKFGVRGFTEALRLELDLADNGVTATCIHPGGIKTNIFRNARLHHDGDDLGDDLDRARGELERFVATTPERAAQVILRAVQRNKRRATIGPDGRAFAALSKLPPGAYQRLIVAGAKRRGQVGRPSAAEPKPR